jgi:2,3-bisphosphoglycerate-independent phosphoglycerate mutase
MDVIQVDGVNGLPDTNIEAKIIAAKDSLKKYDFVFVHIKAADSLGEDGDYIGKSAFIEKIDVAVKDLVDMKDVVLLITGDHSTPCAMKRHSADPVPVVIRGPGVRKDNVVSFGERACVSGGLGHILGADLMPEISNLVGLSKLIGA